MRIEAIFLALGLLVFSASLDRPRAGDTYEPAENAAPLGKAPGTVRPAVGTAGEIHKDVLGKPCLTFDVSSRPLLTDQNIFDYVVAVTNKCPTSIKLQICRKDGSGCSRASVLAYRSKDLVMGFGPRTDAFQYIAKEAP
jgi:hypothetical protein